MKLIKGSEREWNCKHVLDDCASVVVFDGERIIEWQIGWNEPPFPDYKYVFLDEFCSNFNLDVSIRKSRSEECNCLKNEEFSESL